MMARCSTSTYSSRHTSWWTGPHAHQPHASPPRPRHPQSLPLALRSPSRSPAAAAHGPQTRSTLQLHGPQTLSTLQVGLTAFKCEFKIASFLWTHHVGAAGTVHVLGVVWSIPGFCTVPESLWHCFGLLSFARLSRLLEQVFPNGHHLLTLVASKVSCSIPA
jgi:hypothetical protein